MIKKLTHLKHSLVRHSREVVIFLLLTGSTIGLIVYTVFNNATHQDSYNRIASAAQSAQNREASLTSEIASVSSELEKLKNQDQYKRNEELQATIKSIETTYKTAVAQYEDLVDLSNSKNKAEYDKLFALSLKQLSDRNYASAEATLKDLKSKVDAEKQAAIASAGGIDSSKLNTSAAPPGSGYSRQSVPSDVGTFVVDIVAADLGSTRVIVDTASDSDCRDNCPVLPLGDYVSRNGGYAGINGSYFCPASYPSCAGKANSFDLLVMGKNKHYHNSDNNVYSSNPVVVFADGWIRFVPQASGWGRDTGVNGVLSNFPLLVSGGNVVFGGDGDPKKGSKGSRSFVANKGNTVYIGVVRNVTAAEMAHVLKAMGMENAMNLDSGGSTALWHGGYKAGPGRNIPNAIVFVRK